MHGPSVGATHPSAPAAGSVGMQRSSPLQNSPSSHSLSEAQNLAPSTGGEVSRTPESLIEVSAPASSAGAGSHAISARAASSKPGSTLGSWRIGPAPFFHALITCTHHACASFVHIVGAVIPLPA